MKKLSSFLFCLAVTYALSISTSGAADPKNTAALGGSGKMSFKGIALDVRSVLACWSKGGRELNIGLLPVEITGKDAANANVNGYCMTMYALSGKPSPDAAKWTSASSAPYLVFKISLSGDKKTYGVNDAKNISLNAIGWGARGTIAAAIEPRRILQDLAFSPDNMGATKVKLAGSTDPDYEKLKGLRYNAIVK